jgi:predicted dehydrogenase
MHHVDVPRPWAIDPEVAGGWTLYGFGSHEADWILHVANARPLSTFALARRNNPVWRDCDEITATMQLSNGAIATLVMSLNSLAQRAWDGLIIGTKGSMHVTDERIILNDKTIEAPNDKSHGMIPQMREFASAIRNRRRPRASAEDVRFTMQALEAMRISAQTGRPVDASSL